MEEVIKLWKGYVLGDTDLDAFESEDEGPRPNIMERSARFGVKRLFRSQVCPVGFEV